MLGEKKHTIFHSYGSPVCPHKQAYFKALHSCMFFNNTDSYVYYKHNTIMHYFLLYLLNTFLPLTQFLKKVDVA